MNKSRLIVILLVGVIGIGLLLGLKWLLFSSQNVTIVFDETKSSVVTLYRANSEEDLHDISTAKLGSRVAEVKNNQSLKLRQGSYIILVSGDDVIGSRHGLVVNDKPVSKQIPISLSETYLSKLLSREDAAIRTAINREIPTLTTLYVIREGKLYLNGDWYATRLRYIGTDIANRDTLKLIMHKENGQWKLVTDPPEILLNYNKYIDVPKQILKDLNDIEDADSSRSE